MVRPSQQKKKLHHRKKGRKWGLDKRSLGLAAPFTAAEGSADRREGRRSGDRYFPRRFFPRGFFPTRSFPRRFFPRQKTQWE